MKLMTRCAWQVQSLPALSDLVRELMKECNGSALRGEASVQHRLCLHVSMNIIDNSPVARPWSLLAAPHQGRVHGQSPICVLLA
jgi:hypothetical protein